MAIPESALLVIDMQRGLFYGDPAPHAADSVLSNILLLTEKAKLAGASVFFARHTGPDNSPFSEQSPLTQLIPELIVHTEKDRIFIKKFPSCFRETELLPAIRQRGIKRLIISGMKTEFCIDTTCRMAAELGFQVVMISDAHTTVNSDHLSAEQIIAHHNRTLAGPFVSLETAAEFDF